jgi:serine/threonine protein kinase
MSKVYGLKDTKGVGGTPYYMSPEALDERPPDSKSDVFSYEAFLQLNAAQRMMTQSFLR